MNTNELKTQQNVIDLLDSIDVLGLGISRILVNFDKGFYKKNAKTNDETYIEEFCINTVSDALLDEFYGDNFINRPEPHKSKTIVTNKLN